MERGVSAEVNFAQKLASNEKKIRDRAIKRLNRYLSVRSRHEVGLSEPDLLKIWKGLFYCMWMQDKPLIQEELSQRITSLVHCFSKTEDALSFVKVFLETHSREWNGIDKLRLDKFLMMVREMIRQTFMLLSKENWQESYCRKFALSLYNHVLNAHEPRLPDGLKLHMADIFVDEMKKVSVEKLTSKAMLILLQPFIEFILFTNKIELARRVISEVIYKVLKAMIKTGKVVQPEDVDDTSNMVEDMEVDVSKHQKVSQRCFHVDKSLLLKLLFDMAGSKVVRASNRAVVYKLVKRYSKVFDSGTTIHSGSDQTSNIHLSGDSKQVQHFVCDLQFLKDDGKAVDQQQRKKHKKKRIKEDSTSENNVSIGVDEIVVNKDETKTVKTKKKKKGKLSNDENATSVPHINKNKDIDSKKSQFDHESKYTQVKHIEIAVNSNSEHADLQIPVLGDIKGLGNKLNSKNKTNIPSDDSSAEICVNTAVVLNRKRKFVSDETGDLPAPKKKSKVNRTDSEKETVYSPQNLEHSIEGSTKRKTVSSANEKCLNKFSADSTLSVEEQSARNTNSNARPKFRSNSPLKTAPAISPIVLVKYTHIAKEDFKSPQKTLQSPHVAQVTMSESITDLASTDSSDMDMSVDISSQSEKLIFHSKGIDDSASGFKKSSVGRKVRSKSESPKKRDSEKKTPASTSQLVADVRPAQSVPSRMMAKTSGIIKTEEQGTPSGMGSKKKVIFDLRRNKANKFQDYLKSIAKQPDAPFEPTKSPVAGILKSPVNSPVLSPSLSEASFEECTSSVPKKGLGYGRRASAPGNLVRTPAVKRKKSLFKNTGRQSPSPSH